MKQFLCVIALFSVVACSATAAEIKTSSYGVMCDGVTDDSAAINSAFAAVRSSVSTASVPQGYASTLVFDTPGVCVVESTINATRIRTMNWLVDFNGAILLGKTDGTPVIDMLGSRWWTFNNLNIWGDATLTPSYGIQFGRMTDNESSGDADFNNVHIHGHYTEAAMYNLAAETMQYLHPRLYNSYSGAVTLIMDSSNLQNITSAFVTQGITVGDHQSFNEQTFLTPDIRNEGSGPAVLLMGDGMSAHRYINGYGVSVDDSFMETYNVKRLENIELDVHVETTGATNILLVDNVTPTSNVNIYGLTIRDHSPNVNDSLVDVTGSTRTVIFSGAEFDIGDHIATEVPLFGDTAANANRIQATGMIKWASNDALDFSQSRFNGTVYARESTSMTKPLGAFTVYRTPNTSSAYTAEFNGGVSFSGLPVGATQAAAGVSAGQAFVDSSNGYCVSVGQ